MCRFDALCQVQGRIPVEESIIDEFGVKFQQHLHSLQILGRNGQEYCANTTRARRGADFASS